MPVPLAPYPTPPATLLAPAYTPPSPANGSTGGQSQLVCSGCRNLLMYPVGATSVCCAVCNAVTAVPPPGSACELRKLQDATNVSVWSKICEMCRLYLYHICWGNIRFDEHD
ncbi:hypothetical protein YC2023_060746 [Brassica napus]